MAREVGDLWPQASGSASLGAEMTNIGFPGTIRPFAHVHMNSGVFHNPRHGTSGVIRFSPSNSQLGSSLAHSFALSFDGGKNYPLELGKNDTLVGIGADVLTPFGPMRVIASGEMAIFASNGDLTLGTLGLTSNINILTVDGSIGIGANNGGITNSASASYSIAAGGLLSMISNSNVALNGTSIDIFTTSNGQDIMATAARDIGLIAGTASLEGGEITLDAFAGSGKFEYRFGPYQSWYIKTSHSNTGGPFNDGYWPIAHSGNLKQLINQAVGGIIRDVGSGLQYQYNFGDEITLTTRPGLSPRGILLKSPVGAKLTIPEDDVSIEHGYGVAVSGFSSTPTNISSYGISMLTINALDVRGSGSNMPNVWVGVDPIRQNARISTSGVLRIDAGSGIIVTASTIFTGSGTRPPLGVSGIFIPPLRTDRTGDMFMQNHGFIDVGIVNDQATANAKAMGIGELVLQTGSGTINVSVGSGIAQFLQLSVMDITTTEQNVPFDVVNYQASDKNYQCGSEAAGTSGQVTIFSPGLYRADFKVQAAKITGTNPQICRYRALLNGAALLGATVNSFHFDNAGAANNSGALAVLFNANAGDKFSVGVLSSLAGADNCRLVTRAALLILQRIGPKRGTF